MDPQLALTEVLLFGAVALVLGGLILFALLRGVVLPALPDLVVRKSEKPFWFWANLIGLAYTLAGCVWALMRALPYFPIALLR